MLPPTSAARSCRYDKWLTVSKVASTDPVFASQNSAASSLDLVLCANATYRNAVSYAVVVGAIVVVVVGAFVVVVVGAAVVVVVVAGAVVVVVDGPTVVVVVVGTTVVVLGAMEVVVVKSEYSHA